MAANDKQQVYERLTNVVDLHSGEALAMLKHGGGGGTFDGMDTVDAKIAAAEARTDTKFAELRADLREFATKGDLRQNIWGAAAVIVASILAAIAFGGDRFDAGLGMADVRQAQMQRDLEQDASVQRIEQKIDELIAASDPAASE